MSPVGIKLGHSDKRTRATVGGGKGIEKAYKLMEVGGKFKGS